MKMPMQVLVARHPEVVANLERRFVGTGESPYTELGERQAERLTFAGCDVRPVLARGRENGQRNRLHNRNE